MNSDVTYSDEPSDICFAITADSGELAIQANILVKSLREQYPDASILTFIPESSIADIDERTLSRLEESTSVTTGEIPIPEYPISALIQSFVEAERQFDSEYLVALDTDTIVLNRLRIPTGGDVWLRPADVGAQYWTSERSRGDWKTLYEEFGYSVPDPFFSLTASVDRRSIPPYWNSGVVVTTDRSLPQRWLNYTSALFSNDSLPVSAEEFFIDQIALALAVRENNIYQLGERENFPLGGRLVIPQETAVIHYGDRRNLTRVVQRHFRSEFNRLDSLPDYRTADILYSILVVMSTKSGLLLTYEKKEYIRSIIKFVIRSEN